MSKGSARRPAQVTQDEFSKRWDATFGMTYRKALKEQIEREVEHQLQAYETLCAWGSKNL